jgi:RES domain-containing protein
VITAWRLCKRKRATEAFDGRGAEKTPGRWHAAGVRAVYTAENRSLAALEVLANAEDKDLLAAALWVTIPVHFDPILVYAPKKFPDDWRQVPAPESTREFGALWLKELRSVVLRVPSAVTLGEFNYVLNPLHPDFSKLRIGPPDAFNFDARLG